MPLLRTDRFAFDVEIFQCVMDNGLASEAIPVQLVNEDISTVRLFRDSVSMLQDLVSIRRRARHGAYRGHVSAFSNKMLPSALTRHG